MPGDKFRFRFQKTGTLRLLSHHDLMRCTERLLRRTEIPFKSTGGFHPTPRFVFALSLPLGIAGWNEVAELEVTQPQDPEDVLARFRAQSPPGLTFKEIRCIDPKSSAVPRRALYHLALPAGRIEALQPTLSATLTRDQLWVDKSHPKPRRVNVRPYIRNLTCRVTPELGDTLELDLWVTGQGTARAEDLLRVLGLRDVLDAGYPLVRVDLEIHDEVAPNSPDGPPMGPPETAPLDHVAAETASDDDTTATAAATWGLSPNGPVVE